MKKVIMLLAATGLASCSSTDRQPSNSLAGSSQSASKSSVQTLEKVSQVSMKSLKTTSSKVVLSTAAAEKSVEKSFGFSKNMTVRAVGFVSATGEKAADATSSAVTFVFEKSQSASQKGSELVSSAGNFIVTTSGSVIESAVSATQKTVSVSVDVSTSALETSTTVVVDVWNSSKTALIGSVTVSKDVASQVSGWVGEGASFVVDSSGRLMKAGSESTSSAIGSVVHQSGQVVGFVVDSAGSIYKVSKNATVLVLTGSSNSMKDLGSSVWTTMKSTGSASVDVVKASAAGTAAVISHAGKSVMMISESAAHLFHSEKYQGPTAPAVN